MKRFKNFSSGLATFLIIYFIFFTMNDIVAQLIFYFGLAVIGKYVFRLIKFIINKLTNIKFCDCGFWNKDEIYIQNYKVVNLKKEDGQNG